MVIISSRDLAKILSTSLAVYISYNEVYPKDMKTSLLRWIILGSAFLIGGLILGLIGF